LCSGGGVAGTLIFTRKERTNVDRRRTDPSLGKGHAVTAPSSGALFGRRGDRRDGWRQRRPGIDPPGAGGPELERAGGRSGAQIPRPLRDHGLVLSRRPERPKPRSTVEGA